MKVRKAIIPAAGLGTRFLPATKAQPKEMLPVVDKPTIQYIVEEAVQSGIEDIIIVTGRGKRAIEDHFDKSYELEETLAMKNKFDYLEEVQAISNLANIHYIRQKEPLGLGHAIWCARKFVGHEPFAVLLGDVIVKSVEPSIKQIIEMYEQTKLSVLAVQEVEERDISKFGIVGISEQKEQAGLFSVDAFVEKPSVESAPSNLAIVGRYVLTPSIFEILEELPTGVGGEIQLTDAIRQLNDVEGVLAYQMLGDRYDIGDKLGFIKATIDFALTREDLKEEVMNYMMEVYKRSISVDVK